VARRDSTAIDSTVERMSRRVLLVVLATATLHTSAGCAQNASPVPRPSTVPATSASDTSATELIPAGFGQLRQDDIALKLQLPDVMVSLMPMNENVIRTLSPDSYRALRDQLDSRKATLARLASQHGLQRGSVWYVSFFGLAPDAHFSPLDLTITVAGREFRPLEVVPLSSGFGNQRLQPRERQAALYLFEDALEVNQPLTVILGTQQTAGWSAILREIEAQRMLVRARARAQQSLQTP